MPTPQEKARATQTTLDMIAQFKAIQDEFNLKLERAAQDVLTNGPTRMLITPSTTVAVPTITARKDYGIVPTIVFLRHNGWTLGAPKHLEKEAEAFGKIDGWIAVMRDYQFKLDCFQSGRKHDWGPLFEPIDPGRILPEPENPMPMAKKTILTITGPKLI